VADLDDDAHPARFLQVRAFHDETITDMGFHDILRSFAGTFTIGLRHR
jgi:hypothetical protein